MQDNNKFNNNYIIYYSQFNDNEVLMKPYTHFVVRRKKKSELDYEKDNLPKGYKIYSIDDTSESEYVDIWYINTSEVEVTLTTDNSDRYMYSNFGKSKEKKLTLHLPF